MQPNSLVRIHCFPLLLNLSSVSSGWQFQIFSVGVFASRILANTTKQGLLYPQRTNCEVLTSVPPLPMTFIYRFCCMTNFFQPVYFNSDILSSERQLWPKLPLLRSLSVAGTPPSSRALILMSNKFSWAPHVLASSCPAHCSSPRICGRPGHTVIRASQMSIRKRILKLSSGRPRETAQWLQVG